jgi:hypothetical protein
VWRDSVARLSFVQRAFLCVDRFNFSVLVFLGFRNCLLTGQSFYCGGWKLSSLFISELQLHMLGFGNLLPINNDLFLLLFSSFPFVVITFIALLSFFFV